MPDLGITVTGLDTSLHAQIERSDAFPLQTCAVQQGQ